MFICHYHLDKTKYGYRMLQRMGWEEGKGLGSEEEGPKEHIKVKVKRDNQGKLVVHISIIQNNKNFLHENC